MEDKQFQRRIEDFACEHCQHRVQGTGYTNHCPHCLYSKHVDVFPGDRKESCGGLMEPIRIEKTDGRERIVHRCLKCGGERKNKVNEEDEFEALLQLAKKSAEESLQ